ncbi:hypothetical protein DICSQDRAFT_163164 [Dichomitus squalens LYAD-421 SS1]|uniref:WW domain-containing protein n=1 Tax=Dichomitus squalens (strain LYAD-421) TaxID=732165 RepID=R7SP09_DICSQ|nr:uncharacterized protein DICSQDRAFT_163164 [Dichomitus squalens LYAD-421 SS1]EJF57939.1 hypothetical protein DICSQDRAFT_163164 [Dichomitus squalens LYAD-421 SS1]
MSDRPSILPLHSDSHGSFVAIPLSDTADDVETGQFGGRAVLDGPMTAEPERMAAESDCSSTVSKAGIWLAPAPVTFISQSSDYNKIKPHDNIGADNRIVPHRTLDSKWKPFVHPEGSVYFRQENCFTNVWLYDEPNLKAIDDTMEMVIDILRRRRIALSDVEVCLDLDIDDDGVKLGCYYVCNKKTEEVFWLHPIGNTFFYDGEDVRILSREHLGLAAGIGYRDHIYMFPHGRHLTPEDLQLLRADLAYHMFDKQTSKSSTAPYSVEDLDNLLKVLKQVEISSEAKETLPQYVVIVARLRTTLCRERFMRFHGERYAQLDSDRSVYEDEHRQRSVLFNVLTWLFFYTPPIYFERLSRVWVDNKVNYDNWRGFIGELQDDWMASITPSTVILSANVGFLAIQSVDHEDDYRSVAQIVSYMSTLLALGNIVACTVLARQHRPNLHLHSDDAIKYLVPRASNRWGMEKLAIIFSIPTAFILWALLFFFIAIAWVCFHNTTIITRVVIAVTTAVSTILVAGIIHNGDWQPEQDNTSLSATMTRMKKLIKTARRFTRGSWSRRWSGQTLISSWIKSRVSLSPKQSLRSSHTDGSRTTPEMSEAQKSAANPTLSQTDVSGVSSH